MTTANLWNHDVPAANFGIDVPDWIESDITCSDIAAIVQGGCASGAYMPAVTYYRAVQTMAEHGDEVLEFIESNLCELPTIPAGESWSGIAVFFLSYAVELWASGIEDELSAAIDAADEDEDGHLTAATFNH